MSLQSSIFLCSALALLAACASRKDRPLESVGVTPLSELPDDPETDPVMTQDAEWVDAGEEVVEDDRGPIELPAPLRRATAAPAPAGAPGRAGAGASEPVPTTPPTLRSESGDATRSPVNTGTAQKPPAQRQPRAPDTGDE